MDRKDLLEFVEQSIGKKYGGSRKAFALDHNIHPSMLSDILNGRRDPNDRFLASIGFRKVERFEAVTHG